MTKYYGIKVSTLLNAADKLSGDLEYLCSLVEKPDSEFIISDAVIYSMAVLTVSGHLDFVLEDLSNNDLSEDGLYVKLSEEDVIAMNDYTERSELALTTLENVCGISLKNN